MKNKNPMGVYLINCNASGQIYIGSSNHMRRRWSRHKKELRKNIHTNHHLQHAWNLYGEAAFVLVVLETCELSAIREREQHYLDTMNPFKPHGFNNSRTAFAPSISDEGRTRISSLHKGKPLSAEHRAKIGAANKKAMSKPETKARMSEAGKRRNKSGVKPFAALSEEAIARKIANMKGKKRTPEQRARMSEAQKGKKKSPEHAAKIAAANKGRKQSDEAIAKSVAARVNKQLYIVTMPDGVEVYINNLKQFCREHNLSAGAMSGVANGVCTHHKGYKVRRVEK